MLAFVWMWVSREPSDSIGVIMSLLSVLNRTNPTESSNMLSERLVLVWLAIISGALFWRFHGFGYDDPYITYRYSLNIAQGWGFVYNHGERILSTTTPLYALLLVVVAWLGLDVPLISNVISCLSLAYGGWVFWKLGQHWRIPLLGLAGALLYPPLQLIFTTIGSEMAFYIALILGGILACVERRYLLMAVLLALATLTRADAVLAVAVVALYVLLCVRPLPWSAALLYCAILLPWFTFAWLYFGAPFPVTLSAKQQQGLMEGSRTFGEGVLRLLRGYAINPWYALHTALALIGIGALVARWRQALLVFGWTICYCMGYVLLGVSSYFWYYAPLGAGLILLVGLGLAVLYSFVKRIAKPHIAQIAAAVVLLAMLAVEVRTFLTVPNTDSRQQIYRNMGLWLHNNTPTDASVGALEIGIIGYYAERRMIDFAGLIQPDVAFQLSKTTTYEDSARWAIERFRPDYLILHDGIFPSIEQSALVQSQCRPAANFDDAQVTYTMTIYSCRYE
jgi:hypothetical protein